MFDTLGFLRREAASRMGLLNDREFKLLWVVDFPLFEKDDETGELKAMHHPFTSPKSEDIPLLDKAVSYTHLFKSMRGYEHTSYGSKRQDR